MIQNFLIFFFNIEKTIFSELKYFFGHSFDVEFSSLSIYGVSRVFPALFHGFWELFAFLFRINSIKNSKFSNFDKKSRKLTFLGRLCIIGVSNFESQLMYLRTRGDEPAAGLLQCTHETHIPKSDISCYCSRSREISSKSCY